MGHVHSKICFGLKIIAYPKSIWTIIIFVLKICHNKNIWLDKKSEYKNKITKTDPKNSTEL